MLLHVARRVLEPLEADLGGLLGLEGDHVAIFHVGLEHARHAFFLVRHQGVHQSDGVFHGQLGSRTDREVGGVHGVTDQHDVVLGPTLAGDGGEGAPEGTVGQQFVSLQFLFEQLAQVGHGGGLVGVFEPGLAPHILLALHDPGGDRIVALLVGVGVHLEQPVLVFLEVEGEGFQGQVRAQPDELALAPVEAGLEVFGEVVAHAAVDAVGGHDQIRFGQLGWIHLGFQLQLDAQLQAAVGQDAQQILAT